MATFENTSETTDEPAGILIYAREMACALGAYLDWLLFSVENGCPLY